ncbi:MAG: transposase family protein [candidate division KSB1 bacterium]|nr:transposase family protein [candidate division KSB1 bacterium]MDZ7364339.1 transposase family protein [candidate division KSB1 bacterium]MDZ7402711.1 transposase family protein [candidate division KSB1 bacterium]
MPDPKAPERNKRTCLAAFIDDFSRLVPHAEFYWDEKFPTLENTFKIAMLKRGVPESFHVDNGKVYSARRLEAVCASLGIRKISCQLDPPLHNRKVEVRYNPFGLSCVHIYYQGRFFQKARPAKISRWNFAAKARTTSTPPATPTGIKPLQQLATQHHAQKQEHAQQLVGVTARADEQTLTLPQFIHAIASALGKKAEAFHPREIEAMQTFFATYQPLRAGTVGIAMAKAVLAHGSQAQHIDVYLEAIKAGHLKWQNSV